MRTVGCLLLLLGVCAAEDLAAELARAVDLETARLRRKAALELAARKDVTLAQWLAAARSFGTFEPAREGVSRRRVPLRVVRKNEVTEITVYVPPAYSSDRPAPVMLAFHWTSRNGRSEHAQWKRLADRIGMIVVSPSEAGPNVGYAFTERERESSLAALRWARRQYNIDENRVFMSGGGRGGHMTWDLALRCRDRFAAVAIWSGAPCMVMADAANNLRYLENVVDLPIRDVQGEPGFRVLLQTVPPVFDKLARLGAKDARLIAVGKGVASFDRQAFLTKAVRDPVPKRVVRMYARRGEGRAFWAEVLAASGKVKEDVRLVSAAEQMRSMSDLEYLQFMQRTADAHTARLEVRRVGPGLFQATGKHITKFRLLLDESMLAAGDEVRVVFNGAERRRTAQRSAAVLLTEFVERFDRTFLPVAELRLP
ncbi:MAG: alpha/beta hydrolase fold domain-containing protein [Planctomycetota bacterium]